MTSSAAPAASLKPYKNILAGESKTLLPGEAVKFNISWDQRDNEGLQFPPGGCLMEMLDIGLNNGISIVTLSESPHISILSP